MTTFIGDITCKLDNKARFLFPSTFKKQIDASANIRFVLKKDIFEKCLILYPFREWEKQINIIREKINPYNKEHSRFLRGFYKDTAEISLDSNNRILIPKKFLQIARLEKEILLIGLDSKIEIWAKDIYDNLQHDNDEFVNLAEKILK